MPGRVVFSGALLSITLALTVVTHGQVVINELMASNESTIEDPDEPGQFEDWFELFNSGPTAVDLSGMYLSDSLAAEARWAIPAGTVIGPGAYLLFWADSDPEQGPNHTNFRLSRGGESVVLFATDARTILDSVTFAQQEPDVSFGRSPDAADRLCHFMEPTPGAPNAFCRSGNARFSRPGGTFVEAFELEITTASPSAELFYTLDGSEPDAEFGIPYTGAIPISETAWVRARVFEPDSLPGPITSEVYLALDTDVERFESNLPLVVIDSSGRRINSDSVFRGVSAVFIDKNQITGRAKITDNADFAGHAGMRIRGQSTQSYPKKQFRFEVWDEYDQDRQVSLLGLPEESDWILRAPYSDKTLMRNLQMYAWSREIGRYAVRSVFVEAFLDFDGDGAVGMDDYVGVYVLMETIKRDRERVNIERLDPTDNSEPEITGGYLLRKGRSEGHGTFTTRTYRDELIFEDPDVTELTAEQRAWISAHFNEFEAVLQSENFDDPVEGYAKYIDVDSFIDHHAMVELSRNVDGFVLSTFLYKDRNEKIHMGPIWDYNGSLGGANYFCSCQIEGWQHEFVERNCPECREGSVTFASFAENSYRWYERLWQDPAFLKLYASRWFELRQGPFSTEKMHDDIDRNVALLTDNGAADNPVTRNFQRWPVLNRYIWPNFKSSGTYLEHVDWMKTWLADRLAWMDEAISSLGGVLRPEFSHPGGPVEEGFEVTITAAEGDIYYTVNGPDPRAADFTVADEALLYSGEPIVISGNTRIRTRALVDGRNWSHLTETVYATEAVPLVVTEVMFNPPRFPEDTATFRTSYEFLELQNIGDTTLDLSGMLYVHPDEGPRNPRFDFSLGSVSQLAPGEHVVIVKNIDAFRERYGDRPKVAGAYRQSLSNSGDAVQILGPVGEPVAHFEYENSWYPLADGGGHSLVIIDPKGPRQSWNEAESWRPSLEVGGSPGRADAIPGGGLQRRGDITQDDRVNLTDAVVLLRALVGLASFPCESEAANRELLDANDDNALDFADPVHVLSYLFLSAQPRNLSPECLTIAQCPSVCTP